MRCSTCYLRRPSFSDSPPLACHLPSPVDCPCSAPLVEFLVISSVLSSRHRQLLSNSEKSLSSSPVSTRAAVRATSSRTHFPQRLNLRRRGELLLCPFFFLRALPSTGGRSIPCPLELGVPSIFRGAHCQALFLCLPHLFPLWFVDAYSMLVGLSTSKSARIRSCSTFLVPASAMDVGKGLVRSRWSLDGRLQWSLQLHFPRSRCLGMLLFFYQSGLCIVEILCWDLENRNSFQDWSGTKNRTEPNDVLLLLFLVQQQLEAVSQMGLTARQFVHLSLLLFQVFSICSSVA